MRGLPGRIFGILGLILGVNGVIIFKLREGVNSSSLRCGQCESLAALPAFIETADYAVRSAGGVRGRRIVAVVPTPNSEAN